MFVAFEFIGLIKKFSEEGTANIIVISLIVISILFFLLFLVSVYNLELYSGIVFVILASIIFVFRKILNRHLENLAKKRKCKQNASNQPNQSDEQKPNPPPSSHV